MTGGHPPPSPGFSQLSATGGDLATGNENTWLSSLRSHKKPTTNTRTKSPQPKTQVNATPGYMRRDDGERGLNNHGDTHAAYLWKYTVPEVGKHGAAQDQDQNGRMRSVPCPGRPPCWSIPPAPPRMGVPIDSGYPYAYPMVPQHHMAYRNPVPYTGSYGYEAFSSEPLTQPFPYEVPLPAKGLRQPGDSTEAKADEVLKAAESPGYMQSTETWSEHTKEMTAAKAKQAAEAAKQAAEAAKQKKEEDERRRKLEEEAAQKAAIDKHVRAMYPPPYELIHH